MSHRGADELSTAIDAWLSRGDTGSGAGLGEIVMALEGGLPRVGDDAARERVRRRLASVAPHPRTPQELLVERALEELERLQHRLREDEYVPWSALAGGVAIAVVAFGVAAWLGRRGNRLA
ncbi:MAG: hypothetical protein NVSMB17_02830 [Candidatus Dormibacteria bacterium]